MTLWLVIEGDATTYSIDDNIISVNFSEKIRNFEQIQQFRNGSHVFGMGNMSAGSVSFTIKHRKIGTGNIWNATRSAMMYFMTQPNYKKMYLYRVDSSGIETRARVFPSIAGSENLTSYIVSDETTYTFLFQDAYFEATIGTTNSFALSGSSMEIKSIINTGDLATYPIIQFTPDGNFTDFYIQLAVGYGFQLTSAFLANDIISYDTKDSSIAINGQSTTGLQSGGSTFPLESGNNTLYVTAAEGVLDITYYGRYL